MLNRTNLDDYVALNTTISFVHPFDEFHSFSDHDVYLFDFDVQDVL